MRSTISRRNEYKVVWCITHGLELKFMMGLTLAYLTGRVTYGDLSRFKIIRVQKIYVLSIHKTADGGRDWGKKGRLNCTSFQTAARVRILVKGGLHIATYCFLTLNLTLNQSLTLTPTLLSPSHVPHNYTWSTHVILSTLENECKSCVLMDGKMDSKIDR